MEKIYTETLNTLEATIRELEIEADSPLQRIEAIIQVIVKRLTDLKDYIFKKWI